MKYSRFLQIAALLAFVGVLPGSSLAQAPANNRLTNDDVIRMVRAGISEDVILRDIELSQTHFVTSANSLIELKNQHVSDRILEAMLDSRAGATRGRSEQIEPRVSGQLGASGHHHLPSFDAALQVDSKESDRISVRKNNIRVEHSGVPLFSLTWKESGSR